MKKLALLLLVVALVAFTAPAYAGGHTKCVVKCEKGCYCTPCDVKKKPVIDIPVQPPAVYIPAPVPEPKHKLLYEYNTKAEWDRKTMLNTSTPVAPSDHRGFIQAGGTKDLVRNVRVLDKVRPVIKK